VRQGVFLRLIHDVVAAFSSGSGCHLRIGIVMTQLANDNDDNPYWRDAQALLYPFLELNKQRREQIINLCRRMAEFDRQLNVD
jgi:hypothetical protein